MSSMMCENCLHSIQRGVNATCGLVYPEGRESCSNFRDRELKADSFKRGGEVQRIPSVIAGDLYFRCDVRGE